MRTASTLLITTARPRRAYQIRHDMLVLVRPDGYCAFTGEPTGESAVQDYLSRFHRQKP
jgi:hypothetical protein